MEHIIFAVIFFFFGAMVGSFCNVVLLRKNTGETMVWGGSRCFSCGKELVWYDNIPIISFLILRGRCRFCQSKISWQYPVVEIIVGFLALIVWMKTLVAPASIFFFTLFASLFLLAAYDARTKIVDRHLLRIFALLAFAVALVRWTCLSSAGGAELCGVGTSDALNVFAKDIIAAAGIWFFFWAFCFFSQGRWMGRGDSSVALWCAMLLGFPLSIAMLLVSYWIGGLVGLSILAAVFARGKRSGIQGDTRPFGGQLSTALKREVPFVPFLALGTFVVWFFDGFISTLITAFFMV